MRKKSGVGWSGIYTQAPAGLLPRRASLPVEMSSVQTPFAPHPHPHFRSSAKSHIKSSLIATQLKGIQTLPNNDNKCLDPLVLFIMSPMGQHNHRFHSWKPDLFSLRTLADIYTVISLGHVGLLVLDGSPKVWLRGPPPGISLIRPAATNTSFYFE